MNGRGWSKTIRGWVGQEFPPRLIEYLLSWTGEKAAHVRLVKPAVDTEQRGIVKTKEGRRKTCEHRGDGTHVARTRRGYLQQSGLEIPAGAKQDSRRAAQSMWQHHSTSLAHCPFIPGLS